MWTEIFNLALNNGLWAVLFCVLLLYVLKDSRSREKKYQTTIESLGNSLSIVQSIKDDIEDIKDAISIHDIEGEGNE